jgi:hypothetical protein
MLLLSIALSVGCGGSDPTPRPTITPVPAGPGAMWLIEGCEAMNLEDWTEQADYLSRSFGETMLEAANTPREELSPHLERMRTLKRLLTELPVPADCAQEAQQSIEVMMTDVVNTFEAYSLDPTIDTQPAVTRAQATLQLIWADIEAFYVRAEATYDAINAGQ